MNTDQIMHLALEMAEIGEIPGDSAVYHGGDDIAKVMIGIDLESAELQLAADRGYDAVITHHPAGGSSKLRFHEVLYRHVSQMTAAGVPEAVAREVIDALAEEYRITSSISNYDHNPSIARLLGMPYLNIHTPLDEIGRRRLQAAADEMKPTQSVGELMAHLAERFAEFRHAMTQIDLRLGQPDRPIGRVVMSHGAGTNGGYGVAKAYFDHGVDTVVYIHCRPHDSQRLRDEYGDSRSLIVTGHIASDAIGINPYVDRLRDEGLDVTALSGILPA